MLTSKDVEGSGTALIPTSSRPMSTRKFPVKVDLARNSRSWVTAVATKVKLSPYHAEGTPTLGMAIAEEPKVEVPNVTSHVVVPEPSTAAMLVLGLLAFVVSAAGKRRGAAARYRPDPLHRA